MDSKRRNFVKKLAAGTAGITLSGFIPGFSLDQSLSTGMQCSPGKIKKFPFFRFISEYSIGDFIPKDQGGKFIQQEILGAENDEIIVEKIQGGILETVYGNPIDWGKLEKTELEKSVWLNRFYYLPPFARMYYLTGEKKYLDFMIRFISKWINENPRLTENKKSKYNWYDMQVAWRAIHLSWCYYLTERGLTAADKKMITDTLEEHAGILLEHFGKQSLNEFNHQSHGALAMLYLGALFPYLPNSKELTATAVKILDHHINHAFYADGGNVEQMFGYYPFEAHIFRDAYLLCKNNNIQPPPGITELLQKMVHYISSVAQPDGTMPPVNDSYPMPVNPILTTLSKVLETEIPEAKSSYFPETQIGVMRSKNERNDWYLMINPAMTIGSHAHAGRLAFNLWYNGEPFITESGCCNYDDPLLVNWYRRSEAHSTVLIDGKSDEATSGTVQWAPKRITGNRITEWIEKPSFTFCRMVSPEQDITNLSVNWSRSLTIVKNSFVVIHDFFDSQEEHDYEILLHLPNIQVEKMNGKGVLLKGNKTLALLPANETAISKSEIKNGLINVNGKNTSAPIVSYHLNGKMAHSAMVVCPAGESGSKIQIEQQMTDEGLGLSILDEKGEKYVVIFRNLGSAPVSFFGHTTDELVAVF